MLSRAVYLLGAAVAILGWQAPAARPAFPGENGRIAFVEGRGNVFLNDIFAINPNGSRRQRLTRSHADERSPTFSPDGREIAFTKYFGQRSYIYVMNADGSAARRVTHAGGEVEPAFSPDGSEIAYSQYTPGGHADIWAVKSDGSDPRRLTHLPGNELEATFSPDGETIAFTHVRSRASVDVMNAAGGRIRALTAERRRVVGWPDFAPDGKRIVYAQEAGNHDVRVREMYADGSRRHVLTDGHFDISPAFSPDGREIAFERRNPRSVGRDKLAGIFIMNSDGAHLHRVPHTSSRDSQPSWGPAQGQGGAGGTTPNRE